MGAFKSFNDAKSACSLSSLGRRAAYRAAMAVYAGPRRRVRERPAPEDEAVVALVVLGVLLVMVVLVWVLAF